MHDDPDIHETRDLIASDKVVGTNVYDLEGKHIGSVERLILEKRSGQVSYAVLSFGGFLGIGHDHYPLPWEKLAYDEGLDGYRVDISKEEVEAAPSYASDEDFDWSGDKDAWVRNYYRNPPPL